MTENNDPLSRRKLLGRIGLLAAAGYSIPAFTTLSMAQAGSGSSGASGGSAPSEASAPSEPSEPSAASDPSTPSGPSGSEAEDVCGSKDPNDAEYLQCLDDNGFDAP